MRKTAIFCFVYFVVPLALAGQQAKTTDGWDAWRFLVGEWTAEGGGAPGRGMGTFSFHFDLDGRILVRNNRVDYPATKDRPAFSHQDLMVIYAEGRGTSTRAIYFDNEGHVIHYTAEFSQDRNSWTFLSDAVPSAPRFRLAYTRSKNGMLTAKFEISPPGKPDSFSTYVEGTARRKKGP
jgi:hypothetical protein